MESNGFEIAFANGDEDDVFRNLLNVVRAGDIDVFAALWKNLSPDEKSEESEFFWEAARCHKYDMLRYLLRNRCCLKKDLLHALDFLLSDEKDVLRAFQIFFEECPELKEQVVFQTYRNDFSTLFHVAIKKNAMDVFEFLIQNTTPESWVLKSQWDESILEASMDYEPAFQILRKYGCTRFCLKNETPRRFEEDEVIQSALLSFNPDIDEDDPISGNTTLHVASRLIYHPAFFQVVLLRHLSKVTQKNRYGQTPLHIAVLYENAAAISVLTSAMIFDDLYKTFAKPIFNTTLRSRKILDKHFESLQQFLFNLDFSFLATNDILSIVYAYLGFENSKKRKLQE